MTDTTYPPYNPTIHHRRSIRLRGYDYSKTGAYFITIRTHNRECLFGAVGAGSKPAPTEAYVHNVKEAIFLAGFPDIALSRPHSRESSMFD